jgi:proteasome lid subunit RPN8/RPN11
MKFNLIQNSFSTILLDAIQFFPQDLSKQAESHGLLFGISNEDIIECEYVFPVGSVRRRTENEITPDRAIDNAIQTARQIVSTSNNIGTYHSHPYSKRFPEWADPSNMDVSFAKFLKEPFMIIIAITRDSDEEKPLDLWYSDYDAAEFIYDKNAKGHDAPKINRLNGKGQSICGEFKKYTFELRGYHFNGKTLSDVMLYSSEAEMLMGLLDEKINLSDLSSDSVYSLRKIEYNLRLINQSDKANNNYEYHIGKIKRNMVQK